MTDLECLARVVGVLAPESRGLHGLSRNGRLLLAIPIGPEEAARTLALYQPQRGAAKAVTALLRVLCRTGGHRWILPSLPVTPLKSTVSPTPPEVRGGLGVLLGSPEHRIRRAIATYQGPQGWEVAKIAFGEEGAGILRSEAAALATIREITPAVPELLGWHQSEDVAMLRMPFKTGSRLRQGESQEALASLNSWFRDLPPRGISEFDEWPSIDRALNSFQEGNAIIDVLDSIKLRPAVRHGDFARWNLLRNPDGSISAIDWEWGHPEGMPGLDLVHYFLQDARLVNRLPGSQAIEAAAIQLRTAECSRHLADSGWPADPLLPIIASLAYKQGAGHQENTEILNAAVARFR